MTEDQTIDMIDTSLDIELTADIVSAYVSNNSVPVGEVPDLIASVYRALKEIAAGAVASPPKRVVWVNLYDMAASGPFPSEKDADQLATNIRLGLENRLGNRAYPIEIDGDAP